VNTVKEAVSKGARKLDPRNFDLARLKPGSAYREVLDGRLESIFLEKEGFHFTQSKWEHDRPPYQFRGLEVVGPKKAPLTTTDSMNGIDKRLSYSIVVEAYRRYDRESGWGTWTHEPPPNLVDIRMMRQDGVWIVISGPIESYAVP
jgi:hypothetical protein